MIIQYSKDIDNSQLESSQEQETTSTQNPARLVETPRLPVKSEYSLDQGTNDSHKENDT